MRNNLRRVAPSASPPALIGGYYLQAGDLRDEGYSGECDSYRLAHIHVQG